MRGVLGLLLLSFVTLGCNGDDAMDGGSGASGNGDGDGDNRCNVSVPARCEDDTRWADVEPIFQERCVSCHLGEAGGPWALTSHSHAASWPEQITEVMETCAMPPPDAGIDMPLEERQRVLSWIRCGSRD